MNVPVQNGNLPQGFCPANYQAMLNEFSAEQFVSIDAIAGLVVSSTPPPDHGVAWLQLDSNGNPVRLYKFAQGAWLSLHPTAPGIGVLWNQGLPDFTTFDGGDANVISSLSGPMWQLMATTLDGKGTQVLQAQVPIGVGALPAPSTFSVPVGGTGGEQTVTLNKQNMPPHTHTVPLYQGDSVNHADRVNTTDETTPQNLNYQTESTGGDLSSGTPPTVALPHNNMQPFYGVYFLQRTNRLFYVVNP